MRNNNGNSVPNQFIITGENKTIFQSYKSKIATCWVGGELTIYSDWDYSKTTLKYLKQFINEETSFTYENKAQFEKLMKESDLIEVI